MNSEEVSPVAPGTASPCPLSLEALPPNLRKHVDPQSPKPLRGMAAKALVPMAPAQLATTLFMLGFDPEPDLAAQARSSAAALPDRILAPALRDNGLDAPTLDFFAGLLSEKDNYLELICLNSATSDVTMARVAESASPKICELIGQNQLRLLRHEPLLRALLGNPQASQATADLVADFAVRSGVDLPDVPALVAARKRVFGEVVPPPAPSAVEVVKAFAIEKEDEPPLAEERKLTFTQQLMRMNVSQKIKLASLGNKEARTLLLRDSNKLVSLAAIQSPRITEGEVLFMANNRTANEEVLRYVYNSRDWTKSYQIKLALVRNPKVPLPAAMRFLPLLHDNDIRDLAKSKNVPGGVQNQARTMMAKRTSSAKGGSH